MFFHWQTSSAWFTGQKGLKSAPITIIYDGIHGSWEDFLQQFTRYADKAGWTARQRINNLYSCLKGEAAEFCEIIFEGDPYIDYFDLVLELGQKFGQNEYSNASYHDVQAHQGGHNFVRQFSSPNYFPSPRTQVQVTPHVSWDSTPFSLKSFSYSRGPDDGVKKSHDTEMESINSTLDEIANTLSELVVTRN